MDSESTNRIRFGVFEADLVAGELRRNGSLVKLQEQPFQVLAALLERPGQVITKEELEARIWGGDTFVDFDRGLATAINKVRHALGDSASRPRFIETVPKRGYRFLAQPVPAGDESTPRDSARRFARIAIAAAALLAIGLAWFPFGRSTPGASSTSWTEAVRVTTDSGLTYQPAISADGRLVAYSSDRAGKGNLDIWAQPVGGEPVQLTFDPADDQSPDLSPDGESVVFASKRGSGGIYVVPSLGGRAPHPIAEHGFAPRYSPDGRWIAYFGQRVDVPLSLYVTAANGGAAKQLARGMHFLQGQRPVWTPDSAGLLFTTTAQEGFFTGLEWHVFTLDGADKGATGAVKAIAEHGQLKDPLVVAHHWNPDGYVYYTNSTATGSDIWRIRVDPRSLRVDGEPQKVLAGPAEFEDPSVASNGRLVFTTQVTNVDLFSLGVDANRGVPRAEPPIRLTTGPDKDMAQAVSEDGTRIGYMSWRGISGKAVLLDTRAGNSRPLSGMYFPVPNAKGDRLLVMLSPKDPGGLRRPAIMSWDGIVQRELPGHTRYHNWSPDERWLAAGGTPFGAYSAIAVLEVDTGASTELLRQEGVSFFQPQFSPDGRWIAWMTVGLPGVWAAPFRGHRPIPRSEWIKVSEGSEGADKPRWSPNGNLLYYLSDRDGFRCIYARHLDSETRRPIGKLLEVYHSHDARLKIGNDLPNGLNIEVANDRIIFCMAELTGNIFMMDPVARD